MLIAVGQNLVMPVNSLPIAFVGAAAFAAGVFCTQFRDSGAVGRSEPHANAAIVEIKPVQPVGRPGKHVEFKRANDGLFYVTGNVNGVPVRFVVDTGATVIVLTQEDAGRVGLEKDSDDRRARIQTVGGSSAMRWAKLDHVAVGGQRIEKLDAAIVSDGLKVSLLGQNYLSELHSMMLRGDRLRFD